MRRSVPLMAAAVAALAGSVSAQLMIPDSGTGDRVMLFDQNNGSLIDPNWITDAGGLFTFTTPKEAAVVRDQIWVSDQVADAVHRFDLNRNFLGSITALPGGLPAANLDNLRGFGVSPDGSEVYLSIFHSNTAIRGVVRIDTSTAASTSFIQMLPTSTSVFDAELYNGELLIPTSGSDSIQRRRLSDGALLGDFASLVDPQQVHVEPDGSVIAVSTIAAAGTEGIYHFNPNGSLRRYIDTEAIKVATGEMVPRASVVLGNGDYLLATSDGVFTIRPTGSGSTDYTFTISIDGVDAQYINAVPEPSSALALALLTLARRRRAY